MFYHIANNGFVYPLGYLESTKPLMKSKEYIYLNDGKNDITFFLSDKNLKIIKSIANKIDLKSENIKFDLIETADRFKGDFGSPAGNDIKKVNIEGFFFEYHKHQYNHQYIKKLIKECINKGVKTQVQMYCCVVNKLH